MYQDSYDCIDILQAVFWLSLSCDGTLTPMRWFKPSLRNSISALLGPSARADDEDELEPVRQAMLRVLGDDGARLNPSLKRRLKFMHDAHSLWYARGELVAVLSRVHGEALAVHRVQSLSPVFQGLVPKSLIDASRIRRV